jgi:hypothetical protein
MSQEVTQVISFSLDHFRSRRLETGSVGSIGTENIDRLSLTLTALVVFPLCFPSIPSNFFNISCDTATLYAGFISFAGFLTPVPRKLVLKGPGSTMRTLILKEETSFDRDSESPRDGVLVLDSGMQGGREWRGSNLQVRISTRRRGHCLLHHLSLLRTRCLLSFRSFAL